MHCPWALQPSPRPAQLTQFPPLAPHSEAVGVSQVEPQQQPVGQVWELQPLQAPPVQICGDWQAIAGQTTPPVPQAPALSTWHTLFESQQPLGQDCWSQTHAPDAQRCPDWQGPPSPQAQAPRLQLSEVAPQLTQAPPSSPQPETEGVRQRPSLAQHPAHDVPSQTQLPSVQCWPRGHSAPEPQTQSPPSQSSDRPRSHAVQLSPPKPQLLLDEG